MQARFLTFSALALVLAAATPAMADDMPTIAQLQAMGACPELPICGNCSPDVSRTRNQAAEAEREGHVFVTRAAEENAPATPGDVQTAPSENMPIFLELDGVPGESAAPTATDPAPATTVTESSDEATSWDGQVRVRVTVNPGTNAPTAQSELDSGAQTEQAGLLLPAVQRVRPAADRTSAPQADGVVVLTPALPSDEAAARGGGTLTLSSSSPPAVMPEQPVCDHCGAHAQVQPPTQAQAQQTSEEQPRRRRGFSLSIGGITLGSDGGVSVAVGDVTGDGRETAGRAHRPVQTTPPVDTSAGRRR